MARKRKKHPLLEKVTIEDFAAEGKCLARHEEKVVFVSGSQVAPGDVVDLQVVKKRKSYLEAIPVNFHQKSSLRIEPFCEHFGTCGGCKWQHIPYSQQLAYKARQVKDNLERIAKIALPEVKPIIASAKTQYYRNKLEFTFSNKKWLINSPKPKVEPEGLSPLEEEKLNAALGFHIPRRFDKILDINHCYLQGLPSNDIRNKVRTYALENSLSFFDLRMQVGLLRNLVIRTSSAGDLMVIVIFFYEDKEAIESLMSFLKEQFPQITSLQYIVNSKKNDSYQDQKPIVFAGKPYIEEEMEGLRFRIGAKSFYQTNAEQAYELYKVARDFADLKGNELVYDLYTGTGTIANFIARSVKKVIGLEYVPEAIEDAKTNSKINTITNTDFYAGDIKDLLNANFLEQHGKPEIVITDPPRAGMHADVVEMLLRTEAKKIVYISCNPATQARDLALLDTEYKLVAVQPVDMFPQTHHVENVVGLVKK